MKGDFTRFTFDAAKHNRKVLMQQGRVQIDADFNEQQDLTFHRVETETGDVVGLCGAPMHHAGFQVVPRPGAPAGARATRGTKPSRATPTGDLLITAGHYYVDGILCENEHDLAYTEQAQLDLPDAVAVTDPGTYLAYLDVWNRHMTALEDPGIREVALGGQDTATRERIVCQVKLFKLGEARMDIPCSQASPWANVRLAAPGGLAARTSVGAPSKDPCIVAPGAGYRRLENQLYRVEVHTGGLLKSATFKWSRDNGSIVTKWESQDGNNLTVSSIGRDKVLSFASGQWVELTDDTRELLGQPGTLVQLVKAEGRVLTINPGTSTDTVALSDFKRNPKVRAWNSPGAQTIEIPATNSGWLQLEDGVEIKFTQGSYTSGDYWTIPARTAIADVEWPIDPATKLPALQLAAGIQHHYCNLALLSFDNGVWTPVSDCRKIFPPLTELTSFFYVGGDGQEAMPDLTPPDALTPLAQPLEVGVANGQWPVEGAWVRFSITKGTGQLQGLDAQGRVKTGPNGIASCTWSLGPAQPNQTNSQQVEAVLLDDAGNPINVPIHFAANLSVADQVAYNPGKACASLQNQKTVQKAIETLVTLASLYPVSGDNQSGEADKVLSLPLQVVASSKCGPIAGARVVFRVVAGGGTVSTPPSGTKTSPLGLAECNWTLGASPDTQIVEAELQADRNTTVPPTKVQFTARIADSGFHVTGLFLRTDSLIRRGAPPELTPLRNNMEVTLPDFAKGLQIECDAEVDPVSLFDALEATRNKPVCFVTLEIPFLADQIVGVNAPFVGFQPVILAGSVGFAISNIPLEVVKTLEDYRRILWTPAELVSKWIDGLFASYENIGVSRLLARLTLKGNFIWAKDTPEVYLDGEVFGVRSFPPNDLRLPSGDGKRGGDLEMWFWVLPAPSHLNSLTLDPTTVIGTQESTGTVGLTGPAPSGGILVTLSSSDPKVAVVPASVPVAAGATSATFKIPTQSVSSTQKLVVTASQGGTVLTAQMTVNIEPPRLNSLTLDPATVIGTQDTTGTVGLTLPAPSGGIVVTLSSSDPTVAAVPPSVTVAAGSTSASFKIPTQAVSSTRQVVVTASQGGTVLTAALTVTIEPPRLNSLKLEPTAVIGGQVSIGTVGLTGPAPSGGLVVALSSSDPKVASVPATVTVAAGATTATFKIPTLAIPVKSVVVITASQGPNVVTAGLTLAALQKG